MDMLEARRELEEAISNGKPILWVCIVRGVQMHRQGSQRPSLIPYFYAGSGGDTSKVISSNKVALLGNSSSLPL